MLSNNGMSMLANLSFKFASKLDLCRYFKHKFDSLNTYLTPFQYMIDPSNMFDNKLKP